VITQHDSIEQAIADAPRHIPLELLVSGKLVAVKPNETRASPEDTTVAADVVGAKLLGFRPQAVRHLWEAAGWGWARPTSRRWSSPR